MPHLLLAVTAHGYGHLAQSSPVVEALCQRIPDLEITLQGDIDPDFARARLPPGFRHIREATDPGLLMDGPLVTRWEASLDAYLAFDRDYQARLAREMDLLRTLAPDLVLADIPWLPLDAARRLGIPAIGLCSLCWFDILRESPIGPRVPEALLERMRAIYAGADCFIRPAPTMPMTWLPNGVDVGPIARRRPNLAGALRERLGLPADRPLALMQFGGFKGFDPLHDWPEQDQVHWLVRSLQGHRRRDASSLDELGIDMLDVLGAVDLILAKPGYGTYAEAACNGVAVLYVSRGDWPEEPVLEAWLRDLVPMQQISLADLRGGHLTEAISGLLARGRPTPVEASGIAAAADLIEPYLR